MKKQIKDFGHTGDVQFVETTLPKGTTIIEKKPVAYGEKSGHVHVFTGDYEMHETKEKEIFIKVGPKGAFSQHLDEKVFKNAGFDSLELLEKADHVSSRLLPNKVYRVGIHQAYDPYLKIKQKVLD